MRKQQAAESLAFNDALPNASPKHTTYIIFYQHEKKYIYIFKREQIQINRFDFWFSLKLKGKKI